MKVEAHFHFLPVFGQVVFGYEFAFVTISLFLEKFPLYLSVIFYFLPVFGQVVFGGDMTHVTLSLSLRTIFLFSLNDIFSSALLLWTMDISSLVGKWLL